MDTRIESLLKSLERNYHRYKETFIDKDTGEEVSVDLLRDLKQELSSHIIYKM